jgi:hypothetical protein
LFENQENLKSAETGKEETVAKLLEQMMREEQKTDFS